MIIIRRKIVKIGNSYGITIPERYRNMQKNKDGCIALYILELEDLKRIEGEYVYVLDGERK